MKNRHIIKRKGFTLVEIIIVLVILAILAALFIPSLTGYINKAKERAAISEARGVLTAAQTTLSECYAIDKVGVMGRITQNSQRFNGVNVGRITNFMLNKMQHILGNEDTIYAQYGCDAKIGVQILKYLNSYTNGSALGSTDDPQYEFPDNRRMDGKSPDEFKTYSASDVGVTVIYDGNGKILFFQMITGDYLVTIFDGEVKAQTNVRALNCTGANVTYRN